MKRPLFALFCLTAVCILFWYPKEYQPDSLFPQGQYYSVSAEGTLLSYTQYESSLSLTLKDCRISYEGQDYRCDRLLVTITSDTDSSLSDLHIGQSLAVNGSLSSFQPARNPGNFDWRNYYLSRHISYRIYADTARQTGGNIDSLADSILQFRLRLEQTLDQVCDDSNTAGILKALLLGNKTTLEEETKTKYENGGILHILSVSGLHVSLLGSAVLLVSKLFRVPALLRGLLSSVLILLYWQLCGGSLSAGRAAIMFLVMTLAPFLGRTYDSLSALSLAGLLFLWDSPLMLFQSGFQLSFGAVLGIQAVCPAFVPKPAKVPAPASYPTAEKDSPVHTYGIKFRDSLSFGLGLQMALLPITLYHFYRYPLYSILLNLLVLPLTTPLFLCGMAGLILSAARIPLGQLCLLPCRWILQFYDGLCGLTLSLPAASSLLGRSALWRIALYYGGLLLFCWLSARKKRIQTLKKETGRIRFSRLPTPVQAAFFLLLLLAVLLLPLPRRSLDITFLDVGQGDCAFLQTVKGTTILIDGGSSDISSMADYRLTPFLESKGTQHLDYVFLSHSDEDHVNGLTDWLDTGGTIGTLVLPALPDTLSAQTSYQELIRLAEQKQIPTLFFQQGSTWTEGDLSIQCLAPLSPEEPDSQRYTSLNSASMVLYLQYQGISLLFTGDCEKEGEDILLAELSRQQLTCHILKAGHHGSNQATDRDLLEQLQPDLVIISCGIRNRYGHPHPDMLARLDTQGIPYSVTASCGAVILSIRNREARIKTMLPPGELLYR